MRADAREINEPVNRSQQVIARDMILQRKLVEQRTLRLLLRPHHRKHPPTSTEGLNQPSATRATRVFQQNLPITEVAQPFSASQCSSDLLDHLDDSRGLCSRQV
jgi:hypothetical protein